MGRRGIPNASFRSSPNGQLLRTWRRDLKGWTQEEVAEALLLRFRIKRIRNWRIMEKGSLRNYVSRWETGKLEIPEIAWNIIKLLPDFVVPEVR